MKTTKTSVSRVQSATLRTTRVVSIAHSEMSTYISVFCVEVNVANVSIVFSLWNIINPP